MSSESRHTPEWTSADEEQRKTEAYEAELVRRFKAGLPLTKIDARAARAAIAKAEGR